MSNRDPDQPSPPLHADRRRAESFGHVADLYDRARPRYPAALIDFLAEGGEAVLDVGCGTGIAAAQLAQKGCAVLGIEIDPLMAELANAKGIEVEVAAFERWDPGARTFGLLTAAQSWHWIEPEAGFRKAAAVLRPGGRIALFWNYGEPAEPLRAALAEVYGQFAPELDARSVLLGHIDDRIEKTVARLYAAGGFETPEVKRFPWRAIYPLTDWRAMLSTHSDHATLPAERRRSLLDRVADVVAAHGGEVRVAYEAVLVTALRR